MTPVAAVIIHIVPPNPEELDMNARTPIMPPVEITVGINISAKDRSSF